MRLANYVKQAFISGRRLVTDLDNPKRKLTDNAKMYKLESKLYDVNADDVIIGTPYLYTINEVTIESNDIIRTFTFKDTESWNKLQ